MWEIWANQLLPKALKSCTKSNKSPNLAPLHRDVWTCLHSFDIWTNLDEVSDRKLLATFRSGSGKTRCSDGRWNCGGSAGRKFGQNGRIERPPVKAETLVDSVKILPGENPLLICNGCMAELLFYLFGFICFVYVELTTDLLVWSNPNQSYRWTVVPLRIINATLATLIYF